MKNLLRVAADRRCEEANIIVANQTVGAPPAVVRGALAFIMAEQEAHDRSSATRTKRGQRRR